ncbi:Uncharacterised protein [uncultured archaeon]|nr:Uncharacterised protein [uncultured archaeon]
MNGKVLGLEGQFRTSADSLDYELINYHNNIHSYSPDYLFWEYDFFNDFLEMLNSQNEEYLELTCNNTTHPDFENARTKTGLILHMIDREIWRRGTLRNL